MKFFGNETAIVLTKTHFHSLEFNPTFANKNGFLLCGEIVFYFVRGWGGCMGEKESPRDERGLNSMRFDDFVMLTGNSTPARPRAPFRIGAGYIVYQIDSNVNNSS